MTNLEKIIYQVEELDAEWNQSPPSVNYERMATVETTLARAAPILARMLQKAIEQRDYEIENAHSVLAHGDMKEELNAELGVLASEISK